MKLFIDNPTAKGERSANNKKNAHRNWLVINRNGRPRTWPWPWIECWYNLFIQWMTKKKTKTKNAYELWWMEFDGSLMCARLVLDMCQNAKCITMWIVTKIAIGFVCIIHHIRYKPLIWLIKCVTHLFTFLNVVFKILKSGRSMGHSCQHFVIILLKSSKVYALLDGRNGVPNCTGPLLTNSIISDRRSTILVCNEMVLGEYICKRNVPLGEISSLST